MTGLSLLLALVLVLGACRTQSDLPDWARPSGKVMRNVDMSDADLIRYRRLQRDDFQSAAPPPQKATYADRIGALTCARIAPADGLELGVRRTAAGYETQLIGVQFVAYMDRACSWWNEGSGHDPAYVLQHEQIHFAIFELEARRLSADAERLRDRMRQRAPTREAAVEAAQRALDEELLAALQRVQERSTRFDEDTSMGVFPERQRKWADRVEAELRSD